MKATSFRLPPETLEQISTIREQHSISTNTEVLRRSVALFAALMTGQEIILRDPATGAERELLIL